MAISRITHLGYAAVADGDLRVVRPPKVLANLPVRLSAGIGLVYFITSLILLQGGGIYKEHILPIFGILAAFGMFVYQTVVVGAGWAYRRRLRMHQRQGTVVYVPLPLLQHIQDVHQQLGRNMAPDVFDADLEKTRALVEQYRDEGLSSKTNKMLAGFIAPSGAS